jgi:5-methylthioadenosine/S-adenosylhomocysteine deaminase
MSVPEYDIALTNGYLLTLDNDWSEYKYGTVLIRGSKIEYAGPLLDSKSYIAKRIIDAGGNIIMPAFFNGHTHSAMSVFRGTGNDLPLENWLNDHIWPAEARYATEENVYLGSMISAIEMIRSGTGIFADMYFFQEETIRACMELGIRIIAGEGILDFPTPNKKYPQEGLKYTEYLVSKFSKHPLVDISIPAHSPYSCSLEVLKEVRQLASALDITATIHLAETIREVEEMESKHGKTSTRFLDDIGFFDGRTVAYHCNHLSHEDMVILKERDVGIVTNPRSNMKLGSGIAPIPELISLGLTIGVGTDGAASNNNQNVMLDMQLLARLHKMDKLDPTVINSRQAIRMAVSNNSAIYGTDKKTGSLEAGKRADLIIIDTDQAHWQPLYDPYSNICYSMQPGDVITSMIDGKVIMDNRRIVTVDEEEFKTRISRLGKEISGQLASKG